MTCFSFSLKKQILIQDLVLVFFFFTNVPGEDMYLLLYRINIFERGFFSV